MFSFFAQQVFNVLSDILFLSNASVVSFGCFSATKSDAPAGNSAKTGVHKQCVTLVFHCRVLFVETAVMMK
jgi:hypothetical protein